jgi:hypothetical protein
VYGAGHPDTVQSLRGRGEALGRLVWARRNSCCASVASTRGPWPERGVATAVMPGLGPRSRRPVAEPRGSGRAYSGS